MVMELPSRQRLAMICLLQDQVDDLLQLIDVFKRYRIDIKAIRWPDRESGETTVAGITFTCSTNTYEKNE